MALAPLAKQLLPPVAVSLARRLRYARDTEWEYLRDGWRAPQSAGWSDPSIAATQRRKWAGFVATVNGRGPLGIAHEATDMTGRDPRAHNVLITFGYVLARAARNRATVSVLDWGGGIGHYAVIARALLPEATIAYTVKDVPDLCAAGRTSLPDVTFESDDDVCLARSYDLVFASGSIHYEQDWGRLLSRLARSSRSWTYITRLPLVTRVPSFVTRQRPHRYGYETEYISWVLNRQEFLGQATAAGLSLEREFLLDERPYVPGAPEQFVHSSFLFRPAREAR
jgi:putative methyltransferase (TIGR04325 family)